MKESLEILPNYSFNYWYDDAFTFDILLPTFFFLVGMGSSSRGSCFQII